MMNLKRWTITIATVCLVVTISSSGCVAPQTKEIALDRSTQTTPEPTPSRLPLDPRERASLLDWCDDLASKNGLTRFRRIKLNSNDVALRVCIGVNTPRDTILLIEKNEDRIKSTLVPSENLIRAGASKNPINLNKDNNQEIWNWVERSGILNAETAGQDCLADPANDSVVIVLEIRQGDSYISRVASEGCCSNEDKSGNLPRFVEELGKSLDVNLFKCVTG